MDVPDTGEALARDTMSMKVHQAQFTERWNTRLRPGRPASVQATIATSRLLIENAVPERRAAAAFRRGKMG
jgi:hypothetical protein